LAGVAYHYRSFILGNASRIRQIFKTASQQKMSNIAELCGLAICYAAKSP